jgi:hypothetical protein
MLQNQRILGLLLALSFQTTNIASAAVESDKEDLQENQSTYKLSDKEKPKKDDIDKEITNQKLRTLIGSKSKYSLSITGNYSGGSISQPFGAVRPNIYGDVERTGDTALSGSFSLRYRLSKGKSISVGSGLDYTTPFRTQATTTTQDPFIDYTSAGKLFGLQSVGILTAVLSTSDQSIFLRKNALLDYTHILSHDFGGSRFTLGGVASISSSNYWGSANDYVTASTESAQGQLSGRTSYGIAFYPTMEYKMSDKTSLRTVLGFYSFALLRTDKSQDPGKMRHRNIYQSVGVGIAATRDIYIYPNVQFAPDNINTKDSNFGVSLTMNSF